MSAEDTVRRLQLITDAMVMHADTLRFVTKDADGQEYISDLAFENEQVILLDDAEWALMGGEPDQHELDLRESLGKE